ncbi:MAG: phosphotransferase [Stagnimonas sp.]|nr:phosphotransferase [Stagnimonas sp.]
MTANILTALDARAQAARRFALQALSLADAGFGPASADASFRRYFRLTAGADSWVVMDAPPEREDCKPFLHVAQLLLDAGLNGPRVLAQDLEQGFLLLSDLGHQTFLHVLTGDNADALFTAAIAALVQWQQASRPDVLPPYDPALLARELALFPDWYVAKHLGRSFTPQQQGWWDETCALLIARASAQSRVFVHRDYMPRNLMLSTPNPGVLDFQDAVYGPISYDVVSLFKDAFASWPAERVAVWRKQYWDAARAADLPVPADYSAFVRDFDLMGLQRHLKVLGIFARINYRDGKPHYLADTPRFIRYVREVVDGDAELLPLKQLFDSLDLHA